MDVLFEADQQKLQERVERLHRDTHAIAVLLLNKDGQEMARVGETAELDITSLSSLFAGNVAATSEIARLLKEKEFDGQFHEGSNYSIHLSVVSRKAILVVLFDQRSSLGLVRLRVRRITEEMVALLNPSEQSKSHANKHSLGTSSPFGQDLTDADIDRLFGEKTQ